MVQVYPINSTITYILYFCKTIFEDYNFIILNIKISITEKLLVKILN